MVLKGSSLSTAEVAIDTSGLKNLASVLRKAQPEVKKGLYKALRVSGEVVKEQAVFESLWSSRIGGSLKVQGSGLHIRVFAQGSIAPEAAPLEHNGLNGTFRHPVWGNANVWVAQQAHPFLAPALGARFSQVVEIVHVALDDALIAAGFNQ